MHAPPDIADQLAAYQSRFENARRDEIFPFSAIQQTVAQWQARDVFESIPVAGSYCAEELQDAFARLVCEQDLLRAIPDWQRQSWQLLATDAASVCVPVIDLRGVAEKDIDWQLEWLADQLQASKKSSLLPYVAAWVSVSDTEHRLLLAIDPLIWDAASHVTAQRRLADFLQGVPKPIIRTYRDYVHDTWRMSNQEIYDQVHHRFRHPEIAAAVETTARVLEAHAHLPLHHIRLEAPLTEDSIAAKQAFSWFKRWIMQFTGLTTFAMVLHHTGRQLGANAYFDHVGLFLDKIPFAVSPGTALQDLTCKAGYLQKLGVNYVSLERDSAIRRTPTLPRPEQEVVFIFQPQGAPPPDDVDLERRLPGYSGILFETWGRAGSLIVHCAFRGAAADVDTLLNSVPGSRLIEDESQATAEGYG